jgi:hypothetical protein
MLLEQLASGELQHDRAPLVLGVEHLRVVGLDVQ